MTIQEMTQVRLWRSTVRPHLKKKIIRKFIKRILRSLTSAETTGSPWRTSILRAELLCRQQIVAWLIISEAPENAEANKLLKVTLCHLRCNLVSIKSHKLIKNINGPMVTESPNAPGPNYWQNESWRGSTPASRTPTWGTGRWTAMWTTSWSPQTS